MRARRTASYGLLLLMHITLAGAFSPQDDLQAHPARSTPEPTAIPHVIPTVTANRQWQPVISDFEGVKMAIVPPGCFMMGSDEGESNERPAHWVCFDLPFWIDVTEVTNGQFARFEGQAGRSSSWTDGDLPREQITWFEAQAFCQKRGSRLPTEAEWEYAARGPDGKDYPWGNTFVAGNTVFSENSGGQTEKVGSKPRGVSWVGAFDLSGNVWEWVADWYADAYSNSDSAVNPTGPTEGKFRALRGGSWLSCDFGARAAYRFKSLPDLSSDDVGFRCAKDIE